MLAPIVIRKADAGQTHGDAIVEQAFRVGRFYRIILVAFLDIRLEVTRRRHLFRVASND